MYRDNGGTVPALNRPRTTRALHRQFQQERDLVSRGDVPRAVRVNCRERKTCRRALRLQRTRTSRGQEDHGAKGRSIKGVLFLPALWTARQRGVPTPHTHSFATQVLEGGYSICTVQDLGDHTVIAVSIASPELPRFPPRFPLPD